MEEQERNLIKIGEILRILGEKVAELSAKIDKINENHIMSLTNRISVAEEKTRRLESIIYGGLALVAGQAIALIFLFFRHG